MMSAPHVVVRGTAQTRRPFLAFEQLGGVGLEAAGLLDLEQRAVIAARAAALGVSAETLLLGIIVAKLAQ